MNKKFFLILGAVVVAVLLAGCSDDDKTTTVKGEVVSIETQAELAERGIIMYSNVFYVVIEDEDGMRHNIVLSKYEMENKGVVPGDVIKVRYFESLRFAMEGVRKIYDEDGLFIGTEAAERWHWNDAYVVLSTPAVEVVKTKTQVREMEIGTYGYAPLYRLNSLTPAFCIENNTVVHADSTMDDRIRIRKVVLRVEKQGDGFHVSFVRVSELGLNEATSSSVVLPLCS